MKVTQAVRNAKKSTSNKNPQKTQFITLQIRRTTVKIGNTLFYCGYSQELNWH